ncbi:MAG: choline-sulfatase [Gammaproteobacteria bacterium]|nr:MAG: choline-sulfatase [Gammaproteobacteria bacterium]TLY99467.1 MAG: choline-sulfatase [Gammaproteobacteria bacterium]TLZ38733.1 MAG: choline-sulfatase [Gammaproteobacteria bacterium]
MPARPNLLILMADQLTAGVLPAYGGKVAKTPHLDRLADAGVVFESFYCNSPLCAPSRYSWLAGQLPSKIGAYDNAAELAAQVPTFAHYLRRAGYGTVLSGKMHFCGPDQLHGFEERLTTDIYPADFGWTPDWTRFDERPGWYHSMDSVMKAGPCTRTNQIDFDDEVVFAARRKLFDIARGKDRRPFCLVVSMTHPHDPYVIPESYWNRYRDSEIDLPRVTQRDLDEDPHSRRLRHVIGLTLAQPNEAQIRAARRAYLGAVSYVDDQIGSLLATLRQARLDANTVIMVLADHGDMLGERGLWYKMSFFENACRIPLIVHAPERFVAHRVSEPASLLDILPTLVDLASEGEALAYAAPIDGRSLLPALEGGAGPGQVVGEYLAEGAVAPLVMIRRGRYKFVHSAADPDQLYDLSADPDERLNLSSRADCAATVAEFRAEVARRWSLDEIHQAVLASQRRRHLVYAALREGRYRPWDHQPLRDASRLYIRNDQELNDLEAMARFPPLA